MKRQRVPMILFTTIIDDNKLYSKYINILFHKLEIEVYR